MKWLARSLRNLSAHDYKVLHALEKGMKTYEFVPVDLIARYSSLRKERASSILKRLHDFKLVTRQIADYVGYRLTVHGYDALALNVLADSGTIEFFGSKLGVGKESDVYEALTPSGRRVAVKAHRIGRTSFVHVLREELPGQIGSRLLVSPLKENMLPLKYSTLTVLQFLSQST